MRSGILEENILNKMVTIRGCQHCFFSTDSEMYENLSYIFLGFKIWYGNLWSIGLPLFSNIFLRTFFRSPDYLSSYILSLISREDHNFLSPRHLSEKLKNDAFTFDKDTSLGTNGFSSRCFVECWNFSCTDFTQAFQDF